MVRTNQGGSILSFIVVGGVMALLLVGGAYILRHTLAPSENGTHVATSGSESDSSKEPSSSSLSTPDKKNDQSSTTNNSQNNQTSGDTTKKSDETKEQPAAPAGNGQDTNGLPTTGPAGGAFAGIMLSSLVAALLAYVQSRRSSVSL